MKILVYVIISIAMLYLIITKSITHNIKPQKLTAHNNNYHYSNIPTIFIPGWLGSGWSYNRMLKSFQQRNLGQKVLTIIVTPTGKLRVKGTWQQATVNPLIQVIFINNLAGYNYRTKELYHIIRYLQANYHMTAYNVVAHSWGGNAILNLVFSDQSKLPVINKLILLGVPVDEGLDNGNFSLDSLPQFITDQYHYFIKNRKHLMRQNKLTIYNYFGSINGQPTDGETKFSEALAIEPLVKNTPVKVVSKSLSNFSHTQLHTHPQIFPLIAKTLWSKNV